jgi:hypothetical protein
MLASRCLVLLVALAGCGYESNPPDAPLPSDLARGHPTEQPDYLACWCKNTDGTGNYIACPEGRWFWDTDAGLWKDQQGNNGWISCGGISD